MTIPSCFGKSWDFNHVECKGGLDPTYENPKDQSHRRDMCAWFQQCGQATASQGQQQQTQVIPAQSLYQRPVTPPSPMRPPSALFSPARTPIAQAPPQPPFAVQPPSPPVPLAPAYGAVNHYPHPVSQGVLAPPWVAQAGPQMVYSPYQMPGSQMPHYLTIPEPVTPGVHWVRRLLHEIFRSIFKSAGHSTAAFFDANPITQHQNKQ